MGVKKGTKKFSKNHLKQAITQRREVKKHKQLLDRRSKGKKKYGDRPTDSSKSTDENHEGEISQPNKERISVEEFMKSGFEVPEKPESKKTLVVEQPKENEDEKDNSSSDEEDAETLELGIEKLAENDPEFYKYLQNNDKQLLNFKAAGKEDQEQESGQEEEEEEEDELMEEDGEDENESEEVTKAHIKKWKEALHEKNSLRSLKSVVLAFRSAVHMNESQDNLGQTNYRYSVTDPKIFSQLLVLSLTGVPKVLNAHIPISNKTKIADTSSKKFKSLVPLLKSHTSSVVHLLGDAVDSKTIGIVLRGAEQILPYIFSFRRLLKEMIQAIVNIWSSAKDESSRLAAFFVLKRACEQSARDKSFLIAVLKPVYAALLKESRKTSIHTMEKINFLKNSAADLYGIDPVESFQLGFDYVRQLAIHLRNSITQKSPEAYKTVYNWQFCHALDFWSRLLSIQCEVSKEQTTGTHKESHLHPLIYPLVQVTIGTMRLIPAPQYLPLRFYLIRSLIRLSCHTGVYIPLAPTLTEILSSKALTKSGKSSTLRPLDFEHNIRASAAYLNTRVYQEGLGDQFVELLSEFFVLYTKSIAFPELVIPVLVSLRRFVKKSGGSKSANLNREIKNLIEKLDKNAQFIQEKRAKLEITPRDRRAVAAFLKDLDWKDTPLGAYVATWREVREERMRALRSSMEEEQQEDADGLSQDEDIELQDEDDEEEEEDE